MKDSSLLSRLGTVKSITTVDKVEISLRNFFNEANLKPGDRIPKEVELAKALGVSRTAVREALTRLKLLGIVDSRKNRGMIITRPDLLSNVRRVMDPQLLDGETMKDIFELRLVLEIGIADLLFKRKTSEKLEHLEEIVAREEATQNKVELMKIDVEFHSTLYEMSGNNTILQFQKMLLPVFDYVNNGLYPIRQTNNGEYATHRDLVNVLKKGTPEQFRSSMRGHLLQYFDKI
ncbi:MAG: FCD domain-containing protein [Bacteroidota bacterium]|jgi:GntR family transcriptional repressor for pyruvate dehydrogenase complex